MADITRTFTPVVVFPSTEARPDSSSRVRSASTRSGDARSPARPRVSSAVSTIESDGQSINAEDDSDLDLKAALSTPLKGVNIVDLINNKIAKLDQTLKSVDIPSTSKTFNSNASISSTALKEKAVQIAQSRRQVQQFAGVLALKSVFQDQIPAAVKAKDVANEQEQSTLLEVYQFPGFEENHITPLPFNVALERNVMVHVLPKQYVLSKQSPHIKPLIDLYYSVPSKALILDMFWWIFIETYQNLPKVQKKLLERASNSYVALLMMELDLRYRDKCFQVYPSLLAETVFACFKACFPQSIKQMPDFYDSEKKTTANQNKSKSLDMDENMLTEKRIKQLVDLDQFKNDISNICQLWTGGLPALPRKYEQWRSKIVHQEKISFETETQTQITTNTSSSQQSTHGGSSVLTTSPSKPGTESTISSHITSKRKKQPQEVLRDIYKHTNDPLPDRRVIFEDYLFDLNGNSPLTEKFLRSSHMLKNAGLQLYIPHTQITKYPPKHLETYDDEIERAAKICRMVRAEKQREKAKQDTPRSTKPKEISVSKPQHNENLKQKQIRSMSHTKTMTTRSGELYSISQLSLKHK